MKSMVIVALALVAVAVAVPVEDKDAEIVSQNFDQQPDGPYNSGFQTNNGISRNEQGELKQVNDEENKPHTVVVVRGEYSYPSAGAPNGVERIEYYADESGYHASGPSVPKAERR